jgi:rhodanese-related sulfurtransferase
MHSIKEMDAYGLAQRLGKQELLLIDVRTDTEVARGMIEGADHLPLHLLPLHAHDLPRDKAIVFYCQSGARSGQACAYMAARGYGQVYNLQGGIIGWQRAMAA